MLYEACLGTYTSLMHQLMTSLAGFFCGTELSVITDIPTNIDKLHYIEINLTKNCPRVNELSHNVN